MTVRKVAGLMTVLVLGGLPSSAMPDGFTAGLTSTNNPGALGYLLSNVPDNLLDRSGNKLMAK